MEIFIPLIVCIILLFLAFGLGAWAICYQGARNEREQNSVVPRTCHKCGSEFILGVSGIGSDVASPTCDSCAGVMRDDKGNAWLQDESEFVIRETGEVITREQAFANGGRK